MGVGLVADVGPEATTRFFEFFMVPVRNKKAFSQQSCHQGPFDLPSFRLERIFLVRNGKA
jgi:hypothetical protein